MEVRPGPLRKENEVSGRDENGQRMCSINVKDRVPSKELRERQGLNDIILVLQQSRL